MGLLSNPNDRSLSALNRGAIAGVAREVEREAERWINDPERTQPWSRRKAAARAIEARIAAGTLESHEGEMIDRMLDGYERQAPGYEEHYLRPIPPLGSVAEVASPAVEANPVPPPSGYGPDRAITEERGQYLLGVLGIKAVQLGRLLIDHPERSVPFTPRDATAGAIASFVRADLLTRTEALALMGWLDQSVDSNNTYWTTPVPVGFVVGEVGSARPRRSEGRQGVK